MTLNLFVWCGHLFTWSCGEINYIAELYKNISWKFGSLHLTFEYRYVFTDNVLNTDISDLENTSLYN